MLPPLARGSGGVVAGGLGFQLDPAIPTVEAARTTRMGAAAPCALNLGCRVPYVITRLGEGFVEVVAAEYCWPIVPVPRVSDSWVC